MNSPNDPENRGRSSLIFFDVPIPLREETPEVMVYDSHQGWGKLREDCNILGEPLKIGNRSGLKGFGTHAPAVIRLISPRPLQRFKALVGPCVNDFTAANADRVAPQSFRVKVGGKVVAEVRDIPFGEARLLEAKLDGASVFELETTSERLDCAHSGWGEPLGEDADGNRLPCRLGAALGCVGESLVDFCYGGMSSEEFLRKAERTHRTSEFPTYRLHTLIAQFDALRLCVNIKVFKAFPVYEWHVSCENPTSNASLPVSGFASLSYRHLFASSTPEFTRWHGSFHHRDEAVPDAYRDSFLPVTVSPASGDCYCFGASAGRPSGEWLPMFALRDGAKEMRFAVGWAGHWAASGRCENDLFRLRAGLPELNAVLLPGEKIDLPGIWLQCTEQLDEDEAANLWRRFLTREIMEPVNGEPPVAPLCTQSWGGMPEKKHLEKIAHMRQAGIPFEVYWIDAGWFSPEASRNEESDWGNHTGDWQVSRKIYPNGLKAVADAVHQAKAKFLLWAEIERVHNTTALAKAHPEWLLENDTSEALLDLGNPDAWQYCLDTLSALIRENAVDWYRCDFNIEPLEYWQKHDAENRRGITEIRYVSALYRLWRELKKRFPGLMIDNCASGGRRLDLELLRNSLPLWYSDMQCFPQHQTKYTLTHTCGMNAYLPRFSTSDRNNDGGDTYRFRCSMNQGLCLCNQFLGDYDDTRYPWAWLQKNVNEFLAVRDCFAGDFYALSPARQDAGNLTVFQYDLPEKGRGIVQVFREAECPEISRIIRLRHLDDEAFYTIGDVDKKMAERICSGRELMKKGILVKASSPRTAIILLYQKTDISKEA